MSSEAWAWQKKGGLGWNILLALMAVFGLTACETSIPAIDTFCHSYHPVYLDRALDTPQTIEQVDGNNGAYECACLGNCPPSL